MMVGFFDGGSSSFRGGGGEQNGLIMRKERTQGEVISN
jgi:hypothetical protein